ncbi:hypothetical protein ALC57_05891 [Trachymyrmex cornetzi]|uniref:DUF4817 domain-containing protein n=1 Tax=Trachymyrmex cornetzi TaxID=471704 RepID=A0A151J9I4_9HYME|nr:hypothetical protein ALC57_05891 [Trachymyrmex cornetzi]
MNHYQPSEIVDMLLVLGECHTNYREAARVYRDRYSDGRIVNHTTIRRLALRARQGLLRRDGGNHQYDENDNRVVTILGLIHLDPHVTPHVRGKGTHKNQAPRREQRTTTSTSLFLGSAKSSSSMTLMVHNSDPRGRIVDHNQYFVKGLKPAFSSHGEKLGVPFKKTIVTPE